MQKVRTTISLPQDLHEQLRLQAFRERSSISDVLVTRIQSNVKKEKKSNAKKLLKEFDKIAKEIDKQHKGKNLSDLLIEMRYEQ